MNENLTLIFSTTNQLNELNYLCIFGVNSLVFLNKKLSIKNVIFRRTVVQPKSLGLLK